MPCQGPWGGGYGGGNTYKQDYLEAERRLCEARWLILQLTKDGSPEALAELVKQHRRGQIEHRRGDQKHVLGAIDATLDRLKRDEREITRRGGTVGQTLIDQRAALVAAKKRIKALTDDQLLEQYWGNEERLTHDVVDHATDEGDD